MGAEYATWKARLRMRLTVTLARLYHVGFIIFDKEINYVIFYRNKSMNVLPPWLRIYTYIHTYFIL